MKPYSLAMRVLYCGMMSSLAMLCALRTDAQEQNKGLHKDSKGRYQFTHMANATGTSKDLLYARLKSFVIEDLNASDTRVTWDEAGKDSVTTIAYIELGDGPEMTNQLVDCWAQLYFAEGQATLTLSRFNYSGKKIDNGQSYARALHRMNPVPHTAQSYALTLLGEILQQLASKMDALAAGEVR